MSIDWARRVAIVDYGMGNLFSVERACEAVGLPAAITEQPADVLAAAAIVLPGVGAMPDAMESLTRTGLGSAIRDVAHRGTPVFGVCLGMQLLMEEGSEFTPHRGLGIVPGRVERFEGVDERGLPLKVPHIGWNSIHHQGERSSWMGTPLEELRSGEFMYFVHSFYVVPKNSNIVRARTRYGTAEFCAALRHGNVFACQFHPERSGSRGLSMYRAFARHVFPSSLSLSQAGT